MLKIERFLHGVTLLVSILIVADFLLPAKVFTEDVVAIKKERQQYYNAARNYHYSYKVVTPEHEFSVTENFAKLAENEKITYSVSLLFNEINSFHLVASKKRKFYSFRIASGLVLPLIVILALILAYKYKKRNDTLLFVLQMVLLGNLIIVLT